MCHVFHSTLRALGSRKSWLSDALRFSIARLAQTDKAFLIAKPMIKAANNDPVSIDWLFARLGCGDKRDKRDKEVQANDAWISRRSSVSKEARHFVENCHFVPFFFNVRRATQAVQVLEWQWAWQQTGPQNLPFPATPGRRFSDLKHKSSRRLQSTASLKCPVAVRRNTAIPDGDPSALGAGLMTPPISGSAGGINPLRIKIKTEIRIEFNLIQFAGLPPVGRSRAGSFS